MRVAIVYPNEEYGGVYNLGMHLIHSLITSLGHSCEKRYINATDLGSFDLVGFSWQYELDYKNILKLLNQVKGTSFCGGPCVSSNFRILEKEIDFFVLGDVENIMKDILENYKNKDKLSKISGVYVPGVSKKLTFNKSELDFYPTTQKMPNKMDKRFVFGKCFMLEIERGCPFSCNFCPLCGKGVRYRDFEDIKRIINAGLAINKPDRVVIYSASFTHPKRKEILRYLISKNIRVTIPSLRAELVDAELLDLIAKCGQKSLTLAPECGQTLRKTLGKFVSDEIFLKVAEMSRQFSIKLYFMIRLPGMKEKDLDEIIKFVSDWKSINPKLYVSVNPFVSKPNTKMGGFAFDRKSVEHQLKYIRKNLRGRASFGSVRTAEKVWQVANRK